jgi:16S rRNA G527 N7-methylase RsmG
MNKKKLNAFLDLFEKWNKSINLSAASTRAELQEHLDDSLHVVPLLRAHLLGENDARQAASSTSAAASKLTPVVNPAASKLTPVVNPAASKLTPVVNPANDVTGGPLEMPRVLDVGSGGGFPVVIAAIELPEIAFTSLEPVHKKHAFLRTAARELDLPNLEALAKRLDDHDASDYDVAMSRATFDLAEWLAMGSERVRDGGLVLGFEAITRNDLPATIVRHPYSLHGKQRALVVLPVGAKP